MRTWTIPAALAGGVALGVVGVAVGAVLGRPPAPVTAQGLPTPAPRQVTVDAVGVVRATPDVLTLTFGVQVQSGSAVEALRRASERADALLGTLKRAGVAASDLQTAEVSLWPRYDRDGQRVTGYQAGHSVVATVRDLRRAGAVIDAAAAAVGDEITLGGLSLSVGNPEALHAEARRLAVEQARAHAEQLARAAGESVGRVLSIEETGGELPAPVRYAMAGADTAVPIEPGRQEVRLSVRVTFEVAG